MLGVDDCPYLWPAVIGTLGQLPEGSGEITNFA